MIVLLLFSFLAGIATILSPCTLPVLPALLSAGASSGRLRALGVICGLIIAFSVFTLTAGLLVQATGISPYFLRRIAILILALFGLVMLFPRLSNFFAEKTASVANIGTNIQQQSQKVGHGFLGGFILGAALGLVWTPCAGPILASVIALIASHAISLQTVLMLFFYAIGAAIPMFLIIYGGQRLLTSSKFLASRAEGIRKFFGILMLLTAAALATDLDVPLQESISKYFPAVDLENRFWQEGHLGIEDGEKMHPLPLLTVAPELEGASDWINSQPLTMQQLRGKVVLVDFWTYSCINCLRTLPYLKKWYNTYKDKNFIIIGVHTPEFAFEKELKNVEKAVQRLQIPYPVVLDNDYKIWQAYENMYWPAHYLIDTHGMVRQVHFGEGGYVETENAIRELLGLSNLKEKEPAISHRPLTPETYLGYRRGASYPNAIKIQEDLASTYHYEGTLGTDEVALQGKWLVGPENIQSASEDSRLELNFEATRVYLVLGGKSSLPITVLLDGHPLPAKYYTSDMDDKGQIFIRDPRKYDIVNLHGDYGKHLLSLRIPKGISAYAFTFGDE